MITGAAPASVWKEQLKDAAEKIGVKPVIESKNDFVKRERTGKSRAKLWFITREVLARNPNATDADILRALDKQFNERSGPDIINEARWIFARKVESGEIVVAGKAARLGVVMESYSKLIEADKATFQSWMTRGCPAEEIKTALRQHRLSDMTLKALEALRAQHEAETKAVEAKKPEFRVVSKPNNTFKDAVRALVALGHKAKTAEELVAKAYTIPSMTLEDLVRKALKLTM